MGLMLIFLCSFSILNINAFHLVKKIENNTNNSIQLSSITVTESNVDVSKNRLHLVNWIVACDRLFHCVLIKSSYCDYATSTCVCYSNSILIGNECLKYVSLGEICKYSAQCKTFNAVCLFDRCVCKNGYESFAGSCYKNSNKKVISDKNLDDVIIVMIAISIGIVILVTICCTVALCRKKSDGTQRRIQNGEVSVVHPPPEFSPYQTQYAGFNTAINSVEPNFYNIDKPPSYEDVMNGLGSRSNLINPDVPPSASNFTYGTAMQNARPFPS